MTKNCNNCSYENIEWYQDNTCSSPKVLKLDKDKFGNSCIINKPKCSEILPDKTKDCEYFKISIWTRVAKIKSKICSIIATYRYKNIKRV